MALAGKIDAIFEQWRLTDKMGCAILVQRDGEPLCCRCYGLANIEHELPVTPDTVFHIASVSKQFTVMTALLLARDGVWSLDDDIRSWTPEIPAYGSPIRLRHLIHHTSGLRSWLQLALLAGWRLEDVITTADILGLAAAQRGLNAAPGAEYLYCNTGYTLLALAVERAAGVPFDEFCRARIFAPLGMTRTQVCRDHAAIVPGRASSYRATPDGGLEHFFLAFATMGSTSIMTTIGDLGKWERNFHEPVVGDDAMIAQLLARGVLNDGTQISYAGGLQHAVYRGQAVVEHGGSDAGYRAHFMRLPDIGGAVIILANVLHNGLPQLARAVVDVGFADELGAVAKTSPPPTAERPLFRLDAELRQRYTGAYYSDELDIIYRVETIGEELLLRRRRFGTSPLIPLAQDRFEGDIAPGTVDSGPMALAFTVVDGTAVSFLLSSSRARNIEFKRIAY